MYGRSWPRLGVFLLDMAAYLTFTNGCTKEHSDQCYCQGICLLAKLVLTRLFAYTGTPTERCADCAERPCACLAVNTRTVLAACGPLQAAGSELLLGSLLLLPPPGLLLPPLLLLLGQRAVASVCSRLRGSLAGCSHCCSMSAVGSRACECRASAFMDGQDMLRRLLLGQLLGRLLSQRAGIVLCSVAAARNSSSWQTTRFARCD
jgi:hypothetical protein